MVAFDGASGAQSSNQFNSIYLLLFIEIGHI